MTAKELIRTIPDDEIIYFGSSSAFLFVGTKEEFFRDIRKHSQERIDKIFRFMIKNKLRVIDIPRKKEEYFRKMNDKKYNAEQRKNYKAVYENLDNRKIVYENAFNGYKKMIDDFIHYEDREVRETYKFSGAVNHGTYVLVEGCEEGKYWTLEDYRKE